MPNSKEHYEQVLGPVYSWMLGGFPAALGRNADLFGRLGLAPARSRKAVDLGSGCGFQSIPLAQLGYEVTAIDLDGQLLAEMQPHAEGLRIETVEDDLLEFAKYVTGEIELAVCMTDTLLHLETRDDVRRLISEVFDALEPGGRFVLTFRDLTLELEDLDRFIPVRSDDTTVFTCFLEYEPETVKVHDLVYRKSGGRWQFSGSYYRKLRLSPDWVRDEIERAGFATVLFEVEKGSVVLVAARSE